MAEPGFDGPLFGARRRNVAPPNTFSAWQYLLIFLVIVLGAIYSAPNLFPPDPAIQIKPRSDEQVVGVGMLTAVRAKLQDAGIPVIGVDVDEDGGWLRVDTDDNQLRAHKLANDHLNAQSQQFIVALNRASNTPEWLRNLGASPMTLGLDLSGGVHFLLQVNMQDYIESVVASTAQGMRDSMREARINYVSRFESVDGLDVRLAFQNEADRSAARDVLSDRQGFDIREVEYGEYLGLRYRLTQERIQALEDRAIAQNLVSLRNRVNELGVSEPQVQRLGRSRIVVDLPGIQDSARAKEILNKFANLEFRLEALPNTPRFQRETHPYEGRDVDILRRNIVTGNNVQDAQQGYDPETSQPQVSIELDSDGGNRMHDATKDNIGRNMAILFIEQKPVLRQVVQDDGQTVDVFESEETRRLISVANVKAALGFQFRITGLSLREAQDLALLLRAGALAAPMYIVEERTVGASLGEDNIRRGWQSVAIGFALVLVFMLVYYRLFGLAANVALTTNLMLMVAIMSVLGATLTMPGIAGIVLTVGMAVDANVLIFSRIREELKERPPQQAIQAGFDRALLTITDANVTTFFVAIILLSIGSGPVRGFAVTLAVGIVTSMFTAILVTRAIVNLIYGGRKLESIKV